METTIDNNMINHGARRSGRFMMLARKMLIENRKTLLMLCGGYIGILAVIGLLSGFYGNSSTSSTLVTYAFFSGLVCSVIASLMFHDFGNKQGRINALMTPVPQSYKFLIRLIAVFPGAILLVVAGYYALAGCMNLCMGLTYSIWLPVYNPFGIFSYNDGWETVFAFAAPFVLNEGLFILGAIAWPKKSFLKTILVQAALGIVLSFVGFAIAKISRNFTIVVHDEVALIYIVLSCVAAMGIAMIYIAYRLLKRTVL